MSQGDLAARVGVQPGHISHFETGRRGPSLLVLKRLSDVLSASMDYLTGRSDDPELKDSQALGDSPIAVVNRTMKDMTPAEQDIAVRMVRAIPKAKGNP